MTNPATFSLSAPPLSKTSPPTTRLSRTPPPLSSPRSSTPSPRSSHQLLPVRPLLAILSPRVRLPPLSGAELNRERKSPRLTLSPPPLLPPQHFRRLECSRQHQLKRRFASEQRAVHWQSVDDFGFKHLLQHRQRWHRHHFTLCQTLHCRRHERHGHCSRYGKRIFRKYFDLKVASTTKFYIDQSGDLLTLGSTTLQNFTANNATVTNATTTFFASLSTPSPRSSHQLLPVRPLLAILSPRVRLPPLSGAELNRERKSPRLTLSPPLPPPPPPSPEAYWRE